MDEEGIAKAIEIVASMREAARKMDRAIEKKNSDLMTETKKEIMDLQKQLSALI